MTHTKGVWDRNIKANGKYPVVYAGRNQHVAIVCQQKDGAETEANISLIAAAPDLMEQTKRLVWLLSELHGGNEFSNDQLWKWCAEAQDVIRKATY